MEIDADRVGAFFVFAHIDKVEGFAFARLLLLGVVGVGNKRLAPFIFRKRLEEIE